MHNVETVSLFHINANLFDNLQNIFASLFKILLHVFLQSLCLFVEYCQIMSVKRVLRKVLE